MTTFGKIKRSATVQSMQGRADAAAWNTVREWTGPNAIVTESIRATVARLAKR